MKRLAILLMALPLLGMGWYDPTCCNNLDCEPIPFEAVEDTPKGYHVRYLAKRGFAVDVVVPYDKIKHSQDGRFHGCATPDRFLCLYVPKNV